ncbi:MAG: molybdopterin oxidoreductase family protein [Myxococcales bacterium]
MPVDAEAREVATHCPYCALQCAMRLGPGNTVHGDAAFPVNRGGLCLKGWTSTATLDHPERLTRPLVRDSAGALRPASWDEALDRIASGLRAAQEAGGRDAAGVFGSGALTNEKAYLLGKFARVALGTSQIDYNGRFCMSSAAAAATRALGLDRGLPFPVADLASAEVILLVGGNPAETMPPLMQHFDAQRARGGSLIVADPRRSASARAATLHLQLAPGTDAALANGLLHILVRDRLVDLRYIEERTEGFLEARAAAASFWPERVERITGVSQEALERAARLLGTARSAVVLTGRGPEQQACGVDNVLAFINLALALGLPGRRGSGWGCLTGQGNGQGGREHGQKADQLPGYRRIDDPEARRHVGAVWKVAAERLPGPGRSAAELLASLGEPDGVRALLVVGSNPAVCAPDASRIQERLRRLDLLAVADFFLSETAALAHVVLPSAQWAEEDGTVTNLEGRVLRRRRVRPPPPEVRTDLEILCALAERLGEKERFSFAGPREVFEELRRASAGGSADYFGITWERLESGRGVFWPCPSEDHPGTPRLFADRFPTPSGRARFHPVRYRGPAEPTDEHYPLTLTTGRQLAHYQTGNQTRRVDELVRLAPRAVVQIHPATARRHALRNGDEVTLETRRGQARFFVELSPYVREDTLFVPFHWGGEHAVNRLTQAALESDEPDAGVQGLRGPRGGPRVRGGGRWRLEGSWWWWATGWRGRGSWRSCSPAAALRLGRSPSSATSPTATTTASSSPASSRARTCPRTSSSTRSPGT